MLNYHDSILSIEHITKNISDVYRKGTATAQTIGELFLVKSVLEVFKLIEIPNAHHLYSNKKGRRKNESFLLVGME